MKGPLIVFEKDWSKGRINAEVYCKHILPVFTNIKRMYEQEIGYQAVLIEDGATLHTARFTRAQYQERGNFLLVWPANSPDLIPVENV